MPDHSEIDALTGHLQSRLPSTRAAAWKNSGRLPPLLDRALGILRDNHRGQPQQHLLLPGLRHGENHLSPALSYTIQRSAQGVAARHFPREPTASAISRISAGSHRAAPPRLWK
ncbi:MAG: hypothetical protein R3F31_00920 [Verrucomicrobiales bacterium]